MDSRIGLDYIVENSDYVSKLAAALDTNNEIVKKQVFELLSALCAYSRSGYNRAIETLENYKVRLNFHPLPHFLMQICSFFYCQCLFIYLQNIKNERYRFRVVVNELDKCSNLEFKVALLSFINCVIISSKSLQDRIRIRNEFIGEQFVHIIQLVSPNESRLSTRDSVYYAVQTDFLSIT